MPAMPTLVPAELSEWMDDQQGELHEAVGSGDNRRVLMFTSKLSEAAKRIARCQIRHDRSLRTGSAVRVVRGVCWRSIPPPRHPKFSRCRSRPRDISLAGIRLPDSDAESDDEPLTPGPSRQGLRRSDSPDESRNVAPKGRLRRARGCGSVDPKTSQVASPVTANRFAVLRAAEEDHVQAVSVCRDPGHVPGHGRVAVPASASQNSQPVSKRLRLTSRGSAVMFSPGDNVVDALEFDLTREDSSGEGERDETFRAPILP